MNMNTLTVRTIKADLGKMRDGMQRFVGDGCHELFRGARVAFRAGLYLIRAGKTGEDGSLALLISWEPWQSEHDRSVVVADLQLSAVKAFFVALP